MTSPGSPFGICGITSPLSGSTSMSGFRLPPIPRQPPWAGSVRLLLGTPDVNGDNIPDIWTIRADGAVRFYAGTRGEMPHAGVQIVGNGDGVGWKNKQAIG